MADTDGGKNLLKRVLNARKIKKYQWSKTQNNF